MEREYVVRKKMGSSQHALDEEDKKVIRKILDKHNLRHKELIMKIHIIDINDDDENNLYLEEKMYIQTDTNR